MQAVGRGIHPASRPACASAGFRVSQGSPFRKFSVLYLKHNLSAAAIASLQGEAANIQKDITR